MGLFKKKEKTHFERDEEGRVTQVTRNGQPVGATGYERVGSQGESVKVHVDPEYKTAKTGKQLKQEYYEKHPEKKHQTIKKIGRGIKTVDKKVVAYNKRSNIMNPQRTNRRSPYTQHSTHGNVNPFGNLFDTGMTPMSRPKTKKKKKSKTQYKIIGGKAYPIASTMPKKKSKKKQTKRKHELTDPFDFSGW